MATATNSTEGILGLESQTLADEVGNSVGTVALDNALDGAGTKSAKVSCTSSLNSYFIVLGFGINGDKVPILVTSTGFGMSFAFHMTNLPSTGVREIMRLEHAGVWTGGLGIDFNGALRFIYPGEYGIAAVSPLSANTVYRIRFWMPFGTNVDMTVWVDGVEYTEATANDPTGVSSCYLGRTQPATPTDTTSFDMTYDSICWSQGSTAPPDCDVTMLMPSGVGNYTAWSNDYQNIDERPHDGETTFVGASFVNQVETSALPDDDAGIQQNIWAVATWNMHARLIGFNPKIATRLRSGSTDNDTGGVVSTAVYYPNGKVYFVDPADAAAWTAAKINACEVGSVATYLFNLGTDYLHCTQVGLNVASYGGFPSAGKIVTTGGVVAKSKVVLTG